MDVYKAIQSRRTIRRFKQRPIDVELLKRFVNAARVAPSAANLQPLEYFIVSEKKLCANVFETLGWAGYIKPKWTPDETERPTAYIVILVREDPNKYYKWDVGLSAENIMLVAEEENIGSCMLLNINKGIEFTVDGIGDVTMRQEKNSLFIDIVPPKKVCGDYSIIKKWNTFLVEATGKDAKERKKDFGKC